MTSMAHGEASGPPAVILLGGDLMARARLESAARHENLELITATRKTVETTLQRRPARLVVIDLDLGGVEALTAIERARARGLAPERVVGYFSHVDTELGEAARAAGCEALPRGRFWRDLARILRGDD